LKRSEEHSREAAVRAAEAVEAARRNGDELLRQLAERLRRQDAEMQQALAQMRAQLVHSEAKKKKKKTTTTTVTMVSTKMKIP